MSPAASATALMAPALAPLAPSKARPSRSSSASSTPQVKAPCAPPPWSPKFRDFRRRSSGARAMSGRGSGMQRWGSTPARFAPAREGQTLCGAGVAVRACTDRVRVLRQALALLLGSTTMLQCTMARLACLQMFSSAHFALHINWAVPAPAAGQRMMGVPAAREGNRRHALLSSAWLSDLRDSARPTRRKIVLWLGGVSDGRHTGCSFAAYSESLGLVCSKWPWRSAAANHSR
jgi:hypothetical protein